ncbi:MAG: glycosyltransferase [Clostridium sp.]|jgi:glycosyltransferase involved in cell wall biosynthesis|uniref:glycosyltransferase family 4 protein n=1 Tax=Clostridium sp. TaxID=1506 RepID=UPI0025C1AA28|nr:glycosyltransferase [Clostridium sp.]MCH3962839.1 glycosyltransferase [Clostridium sp.]MCI1870861.1 glycosyltransferase [Clostridium sp.]
MVVNILFCIREDYDRNFAGDSMQFIKTIKYLEKKGIKVDINTGMIQDYSKYDIIHLFNLTRIRDTYSYYKKARCFGKKIVLSPVYWNLIKYYKFIHDEHDIELWNRGNTKRKSILQGCDMVYPNSELEGKAICKDFNMDVPYTVVYNGVETGNSDIVKFDFRKKYSLENYILCAARICSRKNQLALCRAAQYLKYELVLVGNINDKAYFRKCMNYRNVKYLGFMDKYNLYNAYRCAKVHILPSFVETPGLSSLEAASLGCNIVSTLEGSSKEYFKDKCIYCDPYSEVSIRKSLENALNMAERGGESKELKEYVNLNYNWEKCIDKLYRSYEILLS